MAIMGRTKRATAQRWNAINKQREKESGLEPKKEEEKKASKEEQENFLKMIKEATAKKSDQP